MAINALETKEIEARKMLQFWVDMANTYGWKEDGSFDKKAIDDTLNTIEAMLLIYNIFAKTKIELADIHNSYRYKIVNS